jgi:hypothetical protein
MELFSLACAAAYCVAALIVGVRLVCLARRTRQLPELMIGSSFLSGAMLGHPATMASEFLASESSTLAWPLAAAGSIGLAAATVCILVAWWRIYHPASRWGPWVVSLWTGLIAVVVVMELGRSAAELAAGANPWEAHRVVVHGGAFLAIAWSGFRYHALLRRRMRIGLADPVVANRIWLWNIAASGVTLQCGYILAIPYLNSIFDAEKVSPAFYGMTGLVIALCITHAFYPPQAYLDRIKRRAGLEPG